MGHSYSTFRFCPSDNTSNCANLGLTQIYRSMTLMEITWNYVCIKFTLYSLLQHFVIFLIKRTRERSVCFQMKHIGSVIVSISQMIPSDSEQTPKSNYFVIFLQIKRSCKRPIMSKPVTG
jgi:hypothetical protein